MEIWQIGNNGMRNPNRLQSGLLAYARYPQYGHLGNYGRAKKGIGLQEEIAFTEFLHNEKIIEANLEINDGSHARKWRYVAQKMAFIYPQVVKGHKQEELGILNTFTPAGKAFLECKSWTAINECFLRAQIVSTERALYKEGAFFSPIRYGSAVILELEKLTGKASIDQLLFDVCLQTSDPTIPPKEVAKRMAAISEERSKASSVRVFTKRLRESLDYSKNKDNFKDYGNTNRRYFLLTGLFEKDGKGIKIAEGKKRLVELIASEKFVEDEQDEFQNLLLRCNIPPLPNDDKTVALELYKDIVALAKEYHILPDKSIEEMRDKSAHEINFARYDLEDRILLVKEDHYALKQPECFDEIDTLLTLIQEPKIQSRSVNGQKLSIPKDERPAYLEWIAWRAFLSIDHMTNSSAKARHFKVDSDFYPVGTAGGGDCDVQIECGEDIFVIEVTLTTGSRQESAETESVRRHVSDIMRSSRGKNVVGVFIANEVASETYNTFKNESYIFDDDVELHPHIVPLTTSQFQAIFRFLFRDGKTYATPNDFMDVFRQLDRKKESFKTWREHIATTVANLKEIGRM